MTGAWKRRAVGADRFESGRGHLRVPPEQVWIDGADVEISHGRSGGREPHRARDAPYRTPVVVWTSGSTS